MKTYQIAVIGERDSVMGFRALGLQTYPVTCVKQAQEKLHLLIKESNCAVIYLTETLAKDMEDVLSFYRNLPHPAVILIPGREGPLRIAETNLKQAIKDAVGVDVL